ncbi:MAG: DUF1501 domain-containing protein [Planctomycetaceae bacterium]|nr:DUF1501 domain-containing protein [Planctomycetaceae bacterium]
MNNNFFNIMQRRHFLADCGVGLGRCALLSMLGAGMSRTVAADTSTSQDASGPHVAPFMPRAKRVIYLFMAGAPSQLELFDHKPKLTELEGKPIPPSVIAGQRYAFIQPDAAVLGPRFRFAKHGESGAELSEVLPHLATVADDIAIARSVHTDLFNHAPAQLFVNTGFGIPGRPSMGSWLSYGLGNEADDLPAFVVLKSGGSLSGGASMWSAGFLPSSHQGVPLRSQGDPILHISNPNGYDTQAQRDSLDVIRQLNEKRLDVVGDPEIATRINAYEMAFRMQARAPELMDFSDETPESLAMYGVDPNDGNAAFANNCLLARRLVESGVRYVQLFDWGWDFHGTGPNEDIRDGLTRKCATMDKPVAALIKDLRQRGLLDETLIVWGGEFGRTPFREGRTAKGSVLGRDHYPDCYTMWMAGAGVKGGYSYGQTDEFGFGVVENKVHVHDLQATILHLLGFDHERLTFRFQGRDYRLTDVHGHVVHELLS